MEDLLSFQLNDTASIKVTIIDSDDELSCSPEEEDASNKNKIEVGSKKVHREISDKELLKKIRRYTKKFKSEHDMNVASPPISGPGGNVSKNVEIIYNKLKDKIEDTSSKANDVTKNTQMVDNLKQINASHRYISPVKTKTKEDNDDFGSISVNKDQINRKRDKVKTTSKDTVEPNLTTNVPSVDENKNCHGIDYPSKCNYEKQESNVLKNIAENVLCIFPSLYNFVSCRSRNPYDEKSTKQAKYQFEKISKEYFLLSYSDILATIIPHKNDPEFLKRFCNVILQLTNPKDYAFTAQNVNMVCSDMIKWTECMKNFLTMQRKRIYTNITPDNTKSANSFAHQHEILSAILNNPAKNYNEDLDGNKTKCARTAVLFSAGPPWGKIEIKTLDNKMSNQNMHCFNNEVSGVRTWTNQLPIRYSQDAQNNFYDVRSSCSISNSRLYTPNCHNKAPASNTTVNNSISQAPAFLSQYDHGQSYYTHNNNIEPPTYDSLYGRRNLPNYQKPTNTSLPQDSNQDLSKTTTNERSSVSRDSGFMSPTIEHILDELQSDFAVPAPPEPGTPVISRVTSMHPDVARAPYRPCSVCGVTTNLSCMGCNVVFYCSERCQEANWPYHSSRCKPEGM